MVWRLEGAWGEDKTPVQPVPGDRGPCPGGALPACGAWVLGFQLSGLWEPPWNLETMSLAPLPSRLHPPVLTLSARSLMGTPDTSACYQSGGRVLPLSGTSPRVGLSELSVSMVSYTD